MKKPSKEKIKAWLKNKGHNQGKLDKMKMDSDEQTRLDLAELHGVTRAEYKRAGV